MGQAYRKQYGMNIVHLLSTNLYGPGDNFDEKTSHVIPALIRRCIEARESGSDYIPVWGSGSATRDFLYVKDAAEGILLAAERYNEPEPVNLGSGHEITIRRLASKIAVLTQYPGCFLWDVMKPTGQPRRILATNLAKEKFGFEAVTMIDEGLQETVKWYNEISRSAR
jgi:GDP-L-fucose synthase